MWWRRTSKSLLPDDDVVRDVIARNVGIAARLDSGDQSRLLELTAGLIVQKRWEPIDQFLLTDEVLVTIAANAALPILAHGLDAYRGVQSILIHPSTRRTSGLRAGPASGVVSDEPMSIVGQASPNTGPLSISWDTALAESKDPAAGRNVVIHEFAHKIDMLDGYSDGTPPMRADELAEWNVLLHDEYERATPDPSDAVLRPYAWTNPAEFFAVCTEAFFCTPLALRGAKPHLYQALADFYRLDPGIWARAI